MSRYGLVTVADLVAVDPVRLNRLSGVADATRREVKARAREWRDRFGATVTGRGHEPMTAGAAGTAGLPDPVEAAELLAAHAGTARAQSRRAVARLLLGLEGSLDPFASQVEMSGALGVTAGRVAQQMGALQDGWAAHAACRELLDLVAEHRPASPGGLWAASPRSTNWPGRSSPPCLPPPGARSRRPASPPVCCAWLWTVPKP